MKLALILLLSTILTLSNGKLLVRDPPEISSQFSADKGIEYRSFIPQDQLNFEKKLIGTLYYDSQNDDACQDFNMTNAGGFDYIMNPIVMADIGGCSFSYKARMAANAGASLLIIVAKSQQLQESGFNHFTVKNVKIDVIMIGREDGQKLIDFVKKLKLGDQYPEIVFQLDKNSANVNQDNIDKNYLTIDFWFSSSDSPRDSLAFFDTFTEVYDILGDNIEFNPHYFTWQCTSCKNDAYISDRDDCISGGRYCDPDPDNQNRKGSATVIEDIRQICLYHMNEDSYYTYLGLYLDGVEDSMTDDEHSEFAEYTLLYSGIFGDDAVKLEDCIRNSFAGKKSGEPLDQIKFDNTIMLKEKELQDQMHVNHFPALYVNWDIYEGSLRNPKQITEFICKHFIEPVEGCKTATVGLDGTHDGVSSTFLFFVVLVTIVLMLLIICLVRSGVKKSVMHDMKGEVNQIVAQYKLFKNRERDTSIGIDE